MTEYTVVGYYDPEAGRPEIEPFVHHVHMKGDDQTVEGAIRAVIEQTAPYGSPHIVAVFEGHLTDASAHLHQSQIENMIEQVRAGWAAK